MTDKQSLMWEVERRREEKMKRDYIDPKDLAVIWFKGGRIGSVRQSELNSHPGFKDFSMSLFQTDINGCQHWSVLGRKSWFSKRPA